MEEKLDQWLRDHAYDVDDIVLGDQGLTSSQLPEFHELLDIVVPGWRETFE